MIKPSGPPPKALLRYGGFELSSLCLCLTEPKICASPYKFRITYLLSEILGRSLSNLGEVFGYDGLIISCS
ncbi:hypothetical protein [Candidatus Megaera venefica]|uniref:hypothetical protein n=1 Tax=Candidatus Megaera venefica TaxID=2055910 RepID=UPI002AD1D69D|nr:hypothetical protein [Candidatus Megaera venefica]